MGCYQCGAPGGDESKLCAACTQFRMDRRNRINANFKEKTPRQKRAARIGSAFIGLLLIVVGYFMLFSGSGPGLLLSDAQKVYARCVIYSNNGRPILWSTEGMRTSSVCNKARNVCEMDPSSTPCQRMLTYFKPWLTQTIERLAN